MILTGEKGFTIAEILVVLITVSILASLAVIGPEFIRNENIAKASKELLADLQRIRQDAMTTGTSANSMGFGIKFVNAGSYTIFEFNDADGDFQYDGTVEEANVMHKYLSSSIVMNKNGATPDNNVLIYDKHGIPRNSDWTFAQMTIAVKHESD